MTYNTCGLFPAFV